MQNEQKVEGKSWKIRPAHCLNESNAVFLSNYDQYLCFKQGCFLSLHFSQIQMTDPSEMLN